MGLYPKAILEYLGLAGVPRGPNTKIYCVDPVHGDDDNAGDRWGQPLATVSAAEDKCVSGHHDTVLLVAGTSACNEDAAITWDKHLTHLVGLGAPTRVAQRTRIVCNAEDLSPFLTISGYGCIFKNLYLWQGQNDAHSLINVSVQGNRNFFENVHFAGGGHAAQAIDGGCSLQISGASECLFKDCDIGIDTVLDTDGYMAMSVAATGGAARNRFDNCHFRVYANTAQTGVGWIEFLGNAGIDRDWVFDRCLFTNLGLATLASGIVVAAGFDPANKRVFLRDCAGLGMTEWDANNRGILYLNNGT